MGVLMISLLALFMGVIAGLRAMTAPAAVAWAAYSGWLSLGGSWLAFLGTIWAAIFLSLLAFIELITDQLPSTPSRKVPQQFAARLVMGAVSGAAIGTPYGYWIAGLVSGLLGAAIGTYGGAAVRPSLAGRFNDAGKRVAIIERKHVGGTCVNTGCKPTKTLVASAYAAHLARRAADYGITVGGDISVDMEAVMRRAYKVTLDSRHGNEQWLEGMANCELIRGHAQFESSDTVRVGEDLFRAPQIFLNVGARATIPDLPGIGEVPFMTNTDIVTLNRLPRHLVIIGGSYIGLEYAQIYRRFGAEVTVVERGPRLIGREDEDISDAVREILENEGIHIRTGAECIRFRKHADGIAVGVDCTDGPPEIIGSDVLLAIGRRPNTDDLGLDKAGVELDSRGFIRVDEKLATSVEGIWAMGDCNGRGAFTHTAYNDFEIIAANLFDGQDRRLSQRLPAYALYIDPPLGRVGMGEAEARNAGFSVIVGKRPMTAVGRAVEKGETKGFMKIVADAGSRKILGAALLGTGGDEAIHGVLDLMNVGASYDDLRWAVPIHPTVSELHKRKSKTFLLQGLERFWGWTAMCGFAGFVGDGQDPEQATSLLSAMAQAIAHRGPDGRGLWTGPGVGLAHVRLSIVGLSDGHQPMTSGNGRYTIAFNGEIFNYVELRNELAERGTTFRTGSDTEVLLELYATYGQACLERLNGDFAFAIWDKLERRLLLARDRMGVRPLFYAERGGMLYFGSEVKALLRVPGLTPALDVFALDQIFTLWAPIAPRTAFQDIFELEPGQALVWHGGSTALKTYWELDFPDAGHHDGAGDDANRDELEALLTDAVRLRMRADVPVGAYLSGGLDSSLIAALAAPMASPQLTTFSVAFDSPEHDESAFQAEVATALGTRHRSITSSLDAIAEIFPEIVRMTERPILRTAPAPLHALAGLVQQSGMKVVLTGEGADEVFAGYDIFREAKIRRFCARQPGSRIRPHLFRKLYPYLPGLKQQSAEYLSAFFGTSAGPADDPLFSHRPRFRTTSAAKIFYSGDLRAELGAYDAAEELASRLPERFRRWHPLHQAQYLETRFLLPGYILSSQGDRMAMAHGVEGRFPFLDHRLVEFATKLSPDVKLRGLREKNILKDVAGDYVPQRVTNRSKQPYRAPDSRCFAGGREQPYVTEIMAPRSIEAGGLFNPVAVAKLHAKCRGRDAERASFLIDGEEYFSRLDQVLRQARKSIFIIGWDFNPDIRLRPRDENSEPIGALLNRLVEERPELEVRVLVWGMGPVYSGKSLRMFGKMAWADHPRISLRLDFEHPLRASHHQKIVVIDDKTAFLGGIDLTARRWDDRNHSCVNPVRVSPDGTPYGPVHDMQTIVTGDIARVIGDVTRRRWRKATGEDIEPTGAVEGIAPWPADLVPALTNCSTGLALTEPWKWKGRRGHREAIRLTHDALKAAERHLYIETQYLASFGVARTLSKRLRQQRGPEIVVIVTRESHGFLEKLMMGNNRNRLIRRLKRADRYDRLRVFYAVTPEIGGSEHEIIVHSKVIIADDCFVRVGSSNLNNRSEGLDTESDLALEPTDGAGRRSIAALRNDLLAEHLAADPAEVARLMDETGSLIRTIEALNVKPRHLKPFDVDVEKGETESLVGTGIIDPKQPFWPIPQVQAGFRRILCLLASIFPPDGIAMGERNRPLGVPRPMQSSPVPPSTVPHRIKLLTYNVHSCIGTDRRLAPERIAEVIASVEPDIIGLQELDVGRRRTGNIDQAHVIGSILEMKYHFHAALNVAEEQYGDAILTALPASMIKAGPIPSVGEQRGALWIEVDLGSQRLQVFNTHLGLRRVDRLAQADVLIGDEWRPSTVAVGLASLRSILLIMALDTPERSASSESDHLLDLKSYRRRPARAMEGTAVAREIRFNAFDMNCVGHIQQGLWTHPRDQSHRYRELSYWIDYARRLEHGLFDGIFLADVVGINDVFGGNGDAALKGAVQVPVNDPMLLVPAMAAVTEHLAFGITANLTYEPPFLFARRMSTLDHLTGGRLGWNIVTGYLDSAAKAIGLDGMAAHDDRYDLADEYMEIMYRLWEESWEDDAVRFDRTGRTYADPRKVHKIHHHGKQYSLDAVHLCEPSPQRTPVLYQAGSSTRGRQFAATHAECVFVNGQKIDGVKAIVDDIRTRAAASGRHASDVKVFVGATIVTGRTEKEAREKFEDYRKHADPEAALVHAAASLGIDFAAYDMDEPIETGKTAAIVSNVEAMTRTAGPQWTKRKLLEQMVLGSRQPPMVGSAEQIADTLVAWVDGAGVDGFNLSRTVVPECFDDVIGLVIPILQERGLYKTSYQTGNLREKLFGMPRLPARHVGAGYRRAQQP
eukprot:g9896.t1